MKRWPATVVFLSSCAARDEAGVRWTQDLAAWVAASTPWLTFEHVQWIAGVRLRRLLRRIADAAPRELTP